MSSNKWTELERKIAEQSQKYYAEGTQELTDEQFDGLVDALRKHSPNSKILNVGWGYDISKDTTPGNKVQHKYGIVGSLNKCHSYTELPSNFKHTKDSIHASLKLDGMSIVLYYKEGTLYDAVTRGDGYTGISVLDKVKFIDDRLIQLCESFTGAVRGEIIMSYKSFETYKQLNAEAKNPRNVTVGIIGRKEGYSELSYLDIVVYSIVGDEEYKYVTDTLSNMVSWLQAIFPNVAPYAVLTVQDYSELYLDKTMSQYKDKWYGIYPADGIVLNLSIHKDVNTNYVSYDSVAYKFPAETKVCEVVNVEWNMSKTQYAIPRVQIVPTELSGAIVEYVTAHNAQNVKDNGIGIGACIEVCRSGEVIPYIKQVLQPGELNIPTTCPVCGHSLSWQGVHIACTNPNCDNLKLQNLLMWINTLAPIDNFGDTLRVKYLQQYLPIMDIDNLMQNDIRNNISTVSGVQDKLFVQMLDKIYEGEYTIPIAVQALNIPRFSNVTCSKLINIVDVLNKLLIIADNPIVPEYLVHEFEDILGNANTASLLQNKDKLKNLHYIKDRIQNTFIENITYKKVAVTGKLSMKRAQFEVILHQHGYELASSVTKDTYALITDNPNSGSSKNKQADKFGIPKYTEVQFMTLLT